MSDVKDIGDLVAKGIAPDFADAEDITTEPTEANPLDAAPAMATLYGLRELERDKTRKLVSLATLPSWPVADNEPKAPHGHGWGPQLNDLLGGGVCSGDLLAIGASAAGAGKTAFLMQVAEGLALRTLDVLEGKNDGPLTPVVLVSEMSAKALTWRSLARWTGFDSRLFRAGASGTALSGYQSWDVDAAWVAGQDALQGPLGRMRQRCMRKLDSDLAGASLVQQLETVLLAMKDDLKGHNREVLPVAVIDPVQRWQDCTKDEVTALNELCKALYRMAEKTGAIVFATSDTNKNSSTGQHRGSDKSEQEEGASVFRGSYMLMHLAENALYLRSTGKAGEIEIVFVKNRWGTVYDKPRYQWDARTGRFRPMQVRDALKGGKD